MLSFELRLMLRRPLKSFGYSLCLLLLWMPMLSLTAAQSLFYFSTPEQAKRFTALATTIRCPVCAGETLAESSAPLAKDLQVRLYQLILQNKSEAAIKAYFVERYGQAILLSPLVERRTILLWGFPAFSIIVSLCLLIYFFCNRQ